jgi:UDP-2,3-diacylglucosamine pyrophosphatase LpxH
MGGIMGNGDYRQAIARGLSAALERAKPIDWDVNQMRLVVFSDLHRGQRNHADDFRHCERNYARAMEFYFDEGYTLMVLGDSEELWEGWPKKVVKAYKESIALEAKFHKASSDRYIKVWGNHDDLWRHVSRVTKHLAPIFGELPIPEALDVTVYRTGEKIGRIFFVHGHQGSPGSDKWGGVSRHFVRWVWRPIQRLFKVSLTTPAKDFEIQGKHDRAMFEWAAARNDLVLIAGHTHNPVFVSRPHVETLERLADDFEKPTVKPSSRRQIEQKEHIKDQIEWAKKESAKAEPEGAVGGRDRPCYFNTGCGSFSNGDVTGIEFVHGEIRLVRWSTDLDDPEDRVLEARDLDGVFPGLGS